nr:Eco57I restriction-modification methylase domain-containing protein [Petrotogaceae bacterium]
KRIREIEKVFSQDHNHENYARKLYLIENCIYGIDIQPIASQISKLRFFLSLVIEQKINYSQPNLGILTLPNLETKFVTADTLITVQKPTQTKLGQDQYEKIEKELQTIRRKYFEARTHKTKAKYRNLDEQKREELKATLEKLGFPVTQSSKIASWNPYNQNYSADFFDPEYMFGINDGFDIVIGNPPYIRQENLKNKKATYIKDYESFKGTSDIYIAFYERGFSLLKENGILTYITSNKWTRASYGKDFRKYILEKAQIRKYIELNGIKVFESATVDTSVMQLEKSRESKDFIYCAIGGDYNLKTKLEEYISKNTIEYKKENLSEEIFTFLTSEEIKIKERIEKIGKPLKDWDISIYRGILTGYNKAFIIDGKTKEELIKKDPKNAEIIKPLLRGKDIKRYKYKFADQWLINSHNGYKDVSRIKIEKDYPTIKQWLDKFYDNVYSRSDQGDTPYNLRNCAYIEEFEKEK